MRTRTMKLTVAAVAAAAALALTACDPEGEDPSGEAAGASGGAAASAPAAGGTGSTSTGGTTGGATGGTKGGATSSAAATGGSTSGGSTAGGSTAGGSTAGGSAGGGKVTQAAQAVKIGQPATVDFADRQANITTKLQITVTGVEIGSIKDFQDAKAPTANAEGHTLVYVSYTIKNLGDASLSFTAPDSAFVVADATGRNGVFLTPTGSTPVAKCVPAKVQGVKKGMETKGCTIIGLAGTGNTPAQVGYTEMADKLKLQASWTK
ncbi:hypothetical protein HUT16_07830 [Kitasatospora sp. NA04385]|uniref:hypothetical protein n=1 Tax=Kitasatospora sp. NA04385 TaxID=2742135 RepID=UPI0015928C25|nr:hypothetical protein [Kitasatospora sp. NA04385]QKW18984.1 hypothetical protein HUT16_07830 [Kitasatospora sp. NA04385]